MRMTLHASEHVSAAPPMDGCVVRQSPDRHLSGSARSDFEGKVGSSERPTVTDIIPWTEK